jgi:anti-sigma28 factor (negative regulator of flagellin synthesis)
MNSKAASAATEQLAKELEAIRYNKIKRIKNKLSSGRYYISPKLVARSLFLAH